MASKIRAQILLGQKRDYQLQATALHWQGAKQFEGKEKSEMKPEVKSWKFVATEAFPQGGDGLILLAVHRATFCSNLIGGCRETKNFPAR